MKKSVKTSSFTLIVSFLCLALVGAALLPLLPVKLHPSKTHPALTVNFSMRNASARVVEMEVTSKLEAMLARMKGVRGIDSRSWNGGGNISIRLDKHANIEAVRFEASSIIRQAWPGLADGVSYPQIRTNSQGNNALRPFLTYTLNSPASPALIQQYAEEYIQPQLARLKGVYEVKVSGATPLEWQLKYDSRQLSTLGLGASDIQSAISAYFRTEFIGKADVVTGSYVEQDFVVHTKLPNGAVYTMRIPISDEGGDTIRTVLNKEWQRLAIVPPANAAEGLPLQDITVKNRDGKIITLDQLVTVRHTEAPARSYYRINGLNSIYLSITAEENANQLLLGQQVKDMIEELSASMPAGYEIHNSYDATEYIDEELNKIYFRTGLTVLILLLFVFLITRKWRYMVLVTVSLAVNLLVAVVLYYLLGIEIQLYTLAGITISLNLIIDNTIVISDHVMHRHNMKAYLSVLTATLTTICALGVVLFLDDKLKTNLEDFAVVVILNLSVSLLVSLFFVPSLMDRLGMSEQRTISKKKKRRLKLPSLPQKLRPRHSRSVAVHFTRIYGNCIRFTCRHRVIACSILILIFGLPVFLLPEKMEDDKGWHGLYNKSIGSDYYKEKVRPIVNTALGGTWRLFVKKVYNGSYFNRKEGETVLHVNATLPNGSTLEQMDNLIRRMESYLTGFPEIKQFQTSVQSAYRASIAIYFTREHQHSGFPYVLKSNITSRALELGGGSWSVHGLEDQGFNNSVRENAGSYRVKLSGYNYDELYGYAEKLQDSLTAHRRVRDVIINSSFSWWKDDYKEFHFNVSTQKLAEANITPMALYSSMQTIFARDLSCGTVRTQDGSENVSLSSRQARQYDSWQMKYLPLTSGDKEFKLYSIADIGIRQQAPEVVKNNQQYTLCLQYEYVGAYQMGEKMLKRELEKFNKALPVGYSAWSERGGGYWNKKDNSQYNLLFLVAAVIFIVTSVLFNSLRQPFAIIFVIPISYIGVFLTFWLFELNFDQGGFAAFILLCGITVNAGIYLLDEYNNIRAAHPNINRVQGYLKAWNVKITPILLTIISTILGFIPFMVGTSKEAFWFPLAAGTIGGLLMSLVGIFIFLPIFCIKREKKEKKKS